MTNGYCICKVRLFLRRCYTHYRNLKGKKLFFPDFISDGGSVLGSYLLSWGFFFEKTECLVATKIEKTLNFLHKNSDNNYYEFALKQAEDKLKERNALEKQRGRKRISHLIRSCFITAKRVSPKFLLRNYYAYRLENRLNY